MGMGSGEKKKEGIIYLVWSKQKYKNIKSQGQKGT